MELTDFLGTLRYPGRFITLGKDGDSYVAIYGVTGRSPSSLARRFVQKENAIYTVATDSTVQKEGNPELLEYPAIRFFENGLVVANGRHIDQITEVENRDARRQLSYALSEEAYEPDEYKTPRITGLFIQTPHGVEGALHIVRFASDGIDHSSWNVPLDSGNGAFISTYRGDDVKPTHSFSGDPRPVTFNFGSADNAAKALYQALSPRSDQSDYRIGLVVVYFTGNGIPEIAIVNRQ